MALFSHSLRASYHLSYDLDKVFNAFSFQRNKNTCLAHSRAYSIKACNCVTQCQRINILLRLFATMLAQIFFLSVFGHVFEISVPYIHAPNTLDRRKYTMDEIS